LHEIIFRGKPISPIGYVIKDDGSRYVDFIYGGYYEDTHYGGRKSGDGDHYIINWNTGGLGFIDKTQVAKESVGQYIGRKDKNGKAIYSGDIVRITNHSIPEFVGVVDFQDCSFVIKNSYITGYRWMDYEVEVIGNMVDNPELLEQYDI